MPLYPFASPDDLVTLTGCDRDLARLAVELASDDIRESIRWDVDQVIGATYTAAGDHLVSALGARTSVRWPTVVLPMLNVTEVASVVVDGVTLEASQFDVERCGIVHLWVPRPARLTVVTYTAGFVRSPEDEAPGVFRKVCLELAAQMASNPERLRSYNIGGASESFDTLDLDEDHRLDNWRAVR